MNLNRKGVRGAVTVFLTLILVPCIIFTCAFGDVSRVALSKSQATAASDLALYSLMANYDVDLKEWYGLVASCQSIDEYYDKSASYFKGMMDANGVEGTASETFLTYLNELKNGTDYTDFLQVEFESEPKIGPVKNGDLTNPALIENGIVEFMKYRGPVEIGVHIYDRFSELNLSNIFNNASKDEPIVEAKQEVATKEAEMMSAILYTYLAIKNYTNTYTKNEEALQLSKFQNVYPEQMTGIWNDYKLITDLITNYYAFYYGNQKPFQNTTDSLPSLWLPTVNSNDTYVNSGHGTFSMSSIGAQKAESEDEDSDEDEYTIDQWSLRASVFGVGNTEDVYGPLNRYISAIEGAAKETVDAASGIPTPTGMQNDTSNEVLYVIKLSDIFATNNRFGTINSNAAELAKLYAKVCLALNCTLPDAEPGQESWYSRLTTAKNRIESTRTNYLSYTTANTDFERLLKNYSDYKGQSSDYLDHAKYNMNGIQFYPEGGFTGAIDRIGQYVKWVREVYVPLEKNVSYQLEMLDTILNGKTFDYKGRSFTTIPLDELKVKIHEFNEARHKWGEEAYKVDRNEDEFAGEEQDEYSNPQPTNDSEFAFMVASLKDEDVDEMKARLLHIQSDLQAFDTALKSLTYGGHTIYDFNGRNDVIAAGLTVISQDPSSISIRPSENAGKVDTYFHQLINPQDENVYTAPQTISGASGNQPDLYQEQAKLFKIMDEYFPKDDSALDEMVDKKEETDKAQDQAKEKAAKEEEESKGVQDDYLYGKGTKDPGDSPGGGSFSAASLITGLVGVVKTVVSGNFDEFRDKIYVVEYCMDMFSYSTYNNEGQHKLAAEKKYTSQDYVKKEGFTKDTKDYKEAWDNAEGVGAKYGSLKGITKYDNRSLTNRPINADNNASNLAEIEYLLYGNASMKDNLEDAYDTLFGLRYALNLIAGFQHFYSGTNATAYTINTIASSIMAATFGIIPMPVTKVLLILVLTTLETVQDLKRLKTGTPVGIYKTKPEYWVCKIPDAEDLGGFFDDLFGGGGANPFKDPTDEPAGLYYSDYMILFLLLQANSDSGYKGILCRIGKLIENNMNMGKGEDAKKFELKKAQVFFDLSATIRVKPLFMSLPIASSMEGVDSGILLDSTDWCTYKFSIIRGYS